MRSALARMARNYIDIIGGIVGYLLWFCAVLQSGACDAPLHFLLNPHHKNQKRQSKQHSA
jgi:hypothetical protein